MAEKDKVTTLNDEIVQAQNQRKEVDAKMSTLNQTISDLTNQETRQQGERNNLRQEFDALKERPHENLEQILKTQNGMADKDVAIAKTKEDLEKTGGLYQAAFKERGGLDQKIDRLEDEAVRTHKIDEFTSNVSNRIEELKSSVNDRIEGGVEFVKEHAEHLAMAGTMTAVDLAVTHDHVVEGMSNPEILRNVVAGAVVEHVVTHHDELLEHANEKLNEFTNSMGTSPDHVERRNLEEEIAKHHDHKDELNTLAQNFKRELATPEPVDVSDQPKDVRGEFEYAANRANELFKQQDKEMSEMQVDNATDPAVRITEVQARQTMAEDTVRERDKVTREMCEPVAKLNVDERNARTLEDSAGLNKAHLERYGMKVANEPDGPEKVKNFASNLEQDQKELQNQLTANRSEAIKQEVHSLQGQHFPEVQAQAQALQGPGLEQSGPQQQGPSGPAM